MDHPRSKTIESTETSIKILEEVSNHDGVGLTTIANNLDIPKSTIHYHLETLIRNELIVRDGDLFYTSLKFLGWAEQRREQIPVYDLSKSYIDKLAQETGELAHLCVEEHGRGVYVYLAHGDDAITLNAYEGQRVPMHATALGKAILAYYPRDDVEDIIERHGLSQGTANAVHSEEALFDELQKVRNQGFAVNDQETNDGIRCVGAPILVGEDNVVASISLSAPASRLTEERLETEVSKKVIGAADVISLRLEHEG